MENIITTIIAVLFITFGARVNSKVKFFSNDWFLQVLLITIGCIILKIS